MTTGGTITIQKRKVSISRTSDTTDLPVTKTTTENTNEVPIQRINNTTKTTTTTTSENTNDVPIQRINNTQTGEVTVNRTNNTDSALNTTERRNSKVRLFFVSEE